MKLGNFSFKVFSIAFTFLCEKNMLVSSANRMKSKTFDTQFCHIIELKHIWLNDVYENQFYCRKVSYICLSNQ